MPEYYIIFIDKFIIKNYYECSKFYYDICKNDILSIKKLNLNKNKRMINYII